MTEPNQRYSFRRPQFAVGWMVLATMVLAATMQAFEPTVSFTLSSERLVGQTVTINFTVGDLDWDFSFANLWVKTPEGRWTTVTGVGVPGDTLMALFSVASSPGSYERSYRFRAAGTYEFALQAVDAAGHVSLRASQTVTVEDNHPPTASFSLSGERTAGQTLIITLNLADPDGDFLDAYLSIYSPSRGWLRLKADDSVVAAGVFNGDSVATSAGTFIRHFNFGDLDGPGDYVFKLYARDSILNSVQTSEQSITVNSAGPIITNRSPSRQVVAPGQSASFEVHVTGTGLLAYQWTRNGRAIIGATGARLTVPSVSYQDSGYYIVRVTDPNGTTRSQAMFLVVAPPSSQIVEWGSGGSSLHYWGVPAGIDDATALVAPFLAIRRDGTAVGWTTPTNLQDIGTDVVAVAGGAGTPGYKALVLRSDGTALTQPGLGVPSIGFSNVVAIAAGYYHLLALRANGTVASEGGAGNDGAAVPAGLRDVVAISAAMDHSLALKENGTVVGWGNGPAVPAGLSDVVAISDGGHFALALKSNGTVVAWGLNDAGQTNVPAGLNNVVAIQAGYSTALALRSDGTVVVWGQTTGGTQSIPFGLSGVFHVSVSPYFDNIMVLRDASGDVSPTITSQPQSLTVAESGNASFAVAASGTGFYSYQWRKNGINLGNGGRITGAKSATLSLTGVEPGDAGEYDVEVSNLLGAAVSNAATLTVTPLPGDFNGDGVADPGWASPATGQRSVWFMTGTAPSGGVDLGAVEPAVQIATAGDFDGDGKPDFVVQNKVTGERSLWLMDGTSRGGTVSLTTQVLDWQIVFTGDVNADGQTDLVWQNLDTGQAVVWFMNGTTRLSIADLGIVDPGLQVVGAADFNADGKPDFLVQHRRTGQRNIWLMNGTARTGTIDLGLQTLDWELGPAADFNGDGKPDLIWQNTQTGLRMVWLMNGGSMTSALSLGVFPPTWRIVGATDLNHDGQVDLVWQDKSVPPVDFNADGHADLLWQNTQSGQITFWFMNNLVSVGSADLGMHPLAWQIVGAADFNGNGKGDILLQNTQTGQAAIWLMNGSVLDSVVSLGTQELVWKIGGAADFNGDGQVDLLWQNTRTGQRSLWYMNGPNLGSAVDLGFQTLDWQICGAGDFNGDGQAEIIWQNTQTGQRTLWFMNGRQLGSAVDLGILSTAWQIVGAADMDGDGQADILMQNTQTGQRRAWIMDGFHINTAVDLTTQPVSWQIAN